eukprot:753931-Hanusia_phi.AAC.6
MSPNPSTLPPCPPLPSPPPIIFAPFRPSRQKRLQRLANRNTVIKRYQCVVSRYIIVTKRRAMHRAMAATAAA